MAEQLGGTSRPYPDAEYRKRALNPLDVLEEELGFYPDGPSFRGGLVGIGRIYDRTKLMQGFARYSRLAVIASMAQGREEGLNGMAPNFLAGETLAMHVLLKPVDTLQRRYFLNKSLFPPTYDAEGEMLLRDNLAELEEHRTKGWREILDTQTPQHQELLMEAAMRAYDDIPNAGPAEDDFMAGYLYAGNLIAYLDSA